MCVYIYNYYYNQNIDYNYDYHKATSASASLKQTVKEVQGELATLTKEQGEMDKIRQETSAEYRQAGPGSRFRKSLP